MLIGFGKEMTLNEFVFIKSKVKVTVITFKNISADSRLSYLYRAFIFHMLISLVKHMTTINLIY